MFVHLMTPLSPPARTAILIALTSFGLAAVICRAWAVGMDVRYENRIAPNVSYGTLQLGNLTQQQALDTLDDWQTAWWNQYLRYRAIDEDGRELTSTEFLPIVLEAESEQSNELVWYDTQAMLGQALAVGQADSRLIRAWLITRAFFQPSQLTPVVVMNEAALRGVLQAKLQGYETAPQDAGFQWVSAYQQPKLISEHLGNTFDYTQAVQETQRQLRQMRNGVIEVKRVRRIPSIDSAQARAALTQLDAIKGAFPLVWNYEDEAQRAYTWTWEWPDVYRAVQPVRHPLTGDIRLLLDGDQLTASWQSIEALVNIEPQDARFEINEDKRVQQFQPSQAGRKLNQEQSLAQLNEQLIATQPWNANRSLTLAVDTVEPQLATQDVNDLGITEVLGVGYSNFGGSPRNRVQNIAVGARKLHGLLIAPGEEFSLLQALRPFTIAGGYLPELVIKGDKIEPEIGGGLCQIGSTTFRAAMNSGMKITERRNHSLVVSYYNDPRNGNPGTDATIYDSSPDFKFINDTGNHILIMTSLNASTGDLIFTFWGTSDGRQASYSEPVVSRWIPAGATKYIPSSDLKPGEEKCQSSHVGAVASFVYSVIKANGEKEDVTYVSSYRPLPKICLVGNEAAGETSPVSPEPAVGELFVEPVPVP